MAEEQPIVQPASPAPPPSPLIPWGWLRAVIYLVVYVAYTVGFSIITVIAFGIQSQGQYLDTMTRPRGILLGAIQIAVLVAITAVMRILIDRQSVMSLGFSLKSPYLKDLFLGLVWGFAMISAVFLILWSIGAITVTGVSFPVSSLLVTIITLLFAAAQEEIVIRGYLLNNLMQSANKYLALALTAVVFSLGHIANPNFNMAALVNIILAGFVLGIYYVHRKNLWFPIGLHVAWNYFQGMVYGSPISGINTTGVLSLEFNPEYDALTGGTFGFEAGWLTSVLLIVVTVALHFVYRTDAGRDR